MITKKDSSLKEYRARIAGVVKYIDENLDKDLSLETLAKAACFSPFHFHRIFNAIVGETPGDFVKRLRLEKTANQLIYLPDLSVTQIALGCGFFSSAAFARAFKEHFKSSATEWRKTGYKKFISQKSKNRKTASKNGKDKHSGEQYFSSVNKNLLRKKMKVEIKRMPKLHLAYVAHLRGYNKGIGLAFEKLCRWGGPRGYINQNSKFIGISLDDPDITPKNKCRYYACITIPEDVATQGEINMMDIPEANCAVYRFIGKEAEIKIAYKSLFKDWLPESGYQPDDYPCYEIYYQSADQNPEKKFEMDICLPVKPL
jgi:AraC family transcriptional regulator